MQLLNLKAIQGYGSVLDYEAHILIRSMYYETGMGKLPINPAHFVGRYALKYVVHALYLSGHESLTDVMRHLQQYVDDNIWDTNRYYGRSVDGACTSFGHGV
jgi:hypothetical protein